MNFIRWDLIFLLTLTVKTTIFQNAAVREKYTVVHSTRPYPFTRSGSVPSVILTSYGR